MKLHRMKALTVITYSGEIIFFIMLGKAAAYATVRVKAHNCIRGYHASKSCSVHHASCRGRLHARVQKQLL